MTRRPHSKWHDLWTLAAALTALLIAALWAIAAAPTQDPAPPASAVPPVTHDRLVRAESRGTARTTPPTPQVVVRATHTPAAGGGNGEEPPSAAGLPPLLLLIRDHESGGNYQAFNQTGCSDENGTWSCGGAFQLSEQYAAVWAAEAGFDGMTSQAQTWPPAIQDAVALFKFNATGGDLWCSWTEYC